jgi:hypothetical protein
MHLCRDKRELRNGRKGMAKRTVFTCFRGNSNRNFLEFAAGCQYEQCQRVGGVRPKCEVGEFEVVESRDDESVMILSLAA